METFSCDDKTSIETEHNENSYNHVNVAVKLEQLDESISSNEFEDTEMEQKESPKKTVFCTEDEFIRDFGGIVESEITLGEYEYDGVIKSEVTHDQNESEQVNEIFDDHETPMSNEKQGCKLFEVTHFIAHFNCTFYYILQKINKILK